MPFTNLLKINVPLLIHADADPTRPYAITARRLPTLIEDLAVGTVEGTPHHIGWNHPETVNRHYSTSWPAKASGTT